MNEVPKQPVAVTSDCRKEIFSVRCAGAVEVIDELLEHGDVPECYLEFVRKLRTDLDLASARWRVSPPEAPK